MVLGLSKSFTIALLISAFVWIGSEDYIWAVWIMGIYIIAKIGWQFLTQ